MQERRHSIANTLEWCLSCTKLSHWPQLLVWMPQAVRRCYFWKFNQQNIFVCNIIWNINKELSGLIGVITHFIGMDFVYIYIYIMMLDGRYSISLIWFDEANVCGVLSLFYNIWITNVWIDVLIFIRGQFWPPGIVVACVCVCVCFNHLLVHTITRHLFKLGSPNLVQRSKTPWLRSLLLWGANELDLQGQI